MNTEKQEKRGYHGNGFRKGYKQSPQHKEKLRLSREKNREFNLGKKKTCIQGHPYITENIYINARGFRSCLTCRKIKDQLYRKNNREKIKEDMKKWKLKNPEKYQLGVLRRSLKTRYGITLEQYNGMIEKQHNLCAICNKNNKKQRLSVDHDHQTGKVRGLLCNHCNNILGLWNDDIKILQSAINYLNK